ncbi:5-oxoprolinase subunit B family protein [Nocardia bhagyanarayanae]|uniref:KipI family sensor histidine kinase inhibitor n=1 Tax=Nocardia bhagyanarayanae TaxID=1215925 RepID=A0A543F708_9NOCA|nr:allophanate hydrolase subunit 1 [Nocardia bhagyanarayanae]TQM29617.1 KipI family sensor histidine kinase inhibitor [Nocardia bhagyanarayanae]
MREPKSPWQRYIRAAGDRALLVTPDEPARAAGLADALRVSAPKGVEDVLPAAETVLVTLNSPDDAESVRREICALLESFQHEVDSGDVSRGTLPHNGSPEPLVVPVRYDGADLADVAELLDMTEDEVIAAHTGTVWRCAFVGFAPGFGYLESPDGRLTVPRRDTARTSIPAGAVALAGGFSAVYPRSTPGGWQLIGRTDLTMWDVDRDPPALIRAGGLVRFEVAR